MATSVEAARTEAPTTPAWRKPVIAALLMAWFVFCNWDSLYIGFAEDDMMNMANAWRHGPLWLLYSQFTPWLGYYRPMGGLFYMPLYHAFGLNPWPYHAAMVALLALNVWLGWRFARALGCSELTAALAALVLCYHPGMGPLYSSVAFIYDALCFTFYVGAFAYYMQIRREGRVLNRRQTAVFLLLYLFALNSKEMALTMPLMLLVYEWIFHSPPTLGGLRAWLTGPGRTILLAGALNLVFLYGKIAGVEPLLDIPAYRPKLSMHRFWVFHKGAFGAMLGEWASLPWTGVAALWLILLYLAFRRREAIPRFSWMFIFLTPLPIQFLLGRGQACLYVTLAGWAVFLAVMFRKLAEAFSRDLRLSPLGRWFRERQIFAAVCATGLVLWGIMVQVRKESDVTPLQQRTGSITNYVIGQFRELNARPPHGSTVVFLSDPFVDWDMLFIAELAFNDRSLRILPARKVPVSPQELAEARAVFDWRENKLVQVRP